MRSWNRRNVRIAPDGEETADGKVASLARANTRLTRDRISCSKDRTTSVVVLTRATFASDTYTTGPQRETVTSQDPTHNHTRPALNLPS